MEHLYGNASESIRGGIRVVWNVLSIVSGGNPLAALVAIVVGVAWFVGIGAILGSLVG